MIIQIKVANYRSIGAEQTLSFVAENTRRHPNNLIPRKGYKLLKTAALFGANASGKSNFVKAISIMRDFVRNSATRMNDGDTIDAAEPYRLDPVLKTEPSRFEITFATDGIVYVYGFAVRRERVEEEWLTAKKEASEAKVYEFRRWYDTTSGKDDWSFDGFSEADEAQIKKRTLENMLALSVGTKEKVELLQPAYRYLRGCIWTFDMSSEMGGVGMQTAHWCQESEDVRHELSALLYGADTGVEDIQVSIVTQEIPDAPSHMPEPFQDVIKAMKKLVATNPVPHIVTSRRDRDGNVVEFDFQDSESQGTQRFFAVAGPILKSLQEGAFIVIDELDASMHPLLTRRLLELFQSAEANKNGAQMLFTTHDSSLLDQDLFRRDQIWLAEKCDGASTFFSLADIQPPIRNTESFLRNYLTGRYGGTPHLGLAFDDVVARITA